MRKITYLLILLLLATQHSFSQEIYKRVSINNINDSVIDVLDQNGIDMTCGAMFFENKLQIELSETELQQLSTQGISYTVMVDDLVQFYSDRALEDLPRARRELAREKQMSLTNAKYSVNEIINNVGQYDECDEIDWTTPVNWNLNPNSSPNSFGGCLTYAQVLQELDDMRTYSVNNGINIISNRLDASPTNQTTVEGRTLWYLRISDNPDVDEAGEPETLYQSLIHSRESATVMNQLFFMWYILENYNSDPAIRNLVNNQALYFIPVFNPDGFVYNQTQAPNGGGLQRKNRNTSGGCTTYLDGIDLNRNSAYYWGNGGASTSTCNDTYLGTAPFSENETQIMRDFFLDHDFELALNHHSFKNAMLHAYAGTNQTNPRPDEYSKYNHDMTYYNRYAHGPSTSISSLNSGNMNDWMLGGPAGTSANGTPTGTGSGKETLAWTPENGLSSEAGSTGSGFWPAPSNFLPIAKRAMRMNFMAAYFSGKYGKVHDLNQSNITATSGNLEFAIENLGQKAADFTVTVTAVSNITIPGATNFAMESFDAADVLDQRIISIPYTLSGLQPDDEVEFKVVLTNDYASDNVLYEANIKKTFTPNVMFEDNPDSDLLTNWTSSGLWTTTTDAYSGTTAIKSNSTTVYATNQNRTLELNGSQDFTNKETVLLQYYAKWDLERSYDFVVIEGSTDGSSWTELCGKLTKPGAPTANNSYSSTSGAGDTNTKTSTDDARQNGITSLYDGDTQDKWNMEEVVIDASNNSFLYNQGTVFLRFRLRTDSSNRKDSYANADFEGFYFDDFKIIEIKVPCDNANAPTGLTVSNIDVSSADITWNNIPSATFDLRYRETGTSTWTDITDISGLSQSLTGLNFNTEYEVQVATRCSAGISAFSASEIFTTLDPCPDTVSSFPYAEDFESSVNGGLGLWTQATNDDGDWTRDSGGTPSGPTGPTGDFDPLDPTGQRPTGFYMYVEATLNSDPGPGSTVYLVSPCIDLTGFENGNLSFYYHMFGTDMGDLTVDVSTDGGVVWTTINTLSGQQHPAQTDPWLQRNVDLSAYNNQNIKLRFSGTTLPNPPGNTNGSLAPFRSDMAIDYINITADEAANSAPPVAVCQNITVQLDNTGNVTIVPTDVDGGSTDDVAITDYSLDIDAFDCSNVGTPVNVTLTVTDAENQTDTCIAIVTVEDQIDPEFVNVPANFTVDCGNNPIWTDPTVTDNCGTGLTATRTDGALLNSGDIFPAGMTTISYSADDGNGNSITTSFTINVILDNQDPVAVCQNITVQIDSGGNATITAAQINNGSSDNCGIASISLSQTNFICADVGTNNVTLIVTDTSGNTDTCAAVVTVTPQDEPVATNCWDDYQFNAATCVWENQGSEPTEPIATNCWDDYQFNNIACEWENLGTPPTEPTGLVAVSITDTEATINWDALSSFDFDLRYREFGNPVWTDILDISANTQLLTTLIPLTEYIVEIRSKCSITETSNYATAITFTTLDDVTGYCASQSTNVNFEYISRVELNTIDNTSDAQFYSDFTAISTILRKNQTYTITVTPTFIGGPFNEGYSVWIDYNRNGDFTDAGEQVFTAGPNSNASVSGSFTVPNTNNVLEEVTRMRVSFKFNDIPDPCEAFQYGEVEDYSIRLAGSDDLIYTNNAWTPYAPSPTTVIENALILDGTYTVTDDVQINNIRVYDGADIVVEKSKSLTVNGDLISSDDVSLESDSNEYASLIVTNSVFGNVEYKRHVNSNAGGNDLIAPPVYGESFIDFRTANPNILSNGANTLFLFGPFDKLTDTYLLYTNTETAPLEAGIGYRSASTDASTFTFTGSVKTRNVESPVVISGPTNPEWNLIGNPYPSYIRLSEFLTANNSKFDSQRSGIYGYDGNASDGWTIWNQAYSDANPNAKITPGQGFLIASASSQDEINFTANMRSIGSDDDFILGRQDESAAISHLKLQLAGASELYMTDFYFTENASLGLDYNYDSGLFGSAPSFSIYSHLVEENEGRNYGVQSIGTTNLSVVAIPLGIHVSEGQQVTISITESTLPETVDVYLEDNLTNTFTLLNTTDYTFTANTNITGTGRFFLRFAETTLSTPNGEENKIEIFTTTQPKALHVKGQLIEDTQLSIYDIQGRLINSISLSKAQTQHQIDISSISSGAYFVTLKNGQQEKTQKVLIK